MPRTTEGKLYLFKWTRGNISEILVKKHLTTLKNPLHQKHWFSFNQNGTKHPSVKVLFKIVQMKNHTLFQGNMILKYLKYCITNLITLRNIILPLEPSLMKEDENWVKLANDTLHHPHIGQRSRSFKGQECTQDMFSHGDTPICQNLVCLHVCMSKSKDDLARLKLMVKTNLILMSRSYRDHKCTLPIISWWYTHMTNIFIKTMSKDKKAVAQTQSHVISPMNLTLRSKVNILSGTRMCMTHHLVVIHPCAKYGKPSSNQK